MYVSIYTSRARVNKFHFQYYHLIINHLILVRVFINTIIIHRI